MHGRCGGPPWVNGGTLLCEWGHRWSSAVGPAVESCIIGYYSNLLECPYILSFYKMYSSLLQSTIRPACALLFLILALILGTAARKA